VLAQLEEQTLSAKFHRLSWRRATSYTWTRLPDPVVRRQFHMLVIEGRAALPEEKFNEVSSGYGQESVLLLHTLWVERETQSINCLFLMKLYPIM
jgi:peptidyl-dipeptidase A